MSEPVTSSTSEKPSTTFKPFVPSEANLTEFTLRAVLIGLVMAVVLGAANAYLGLKAGMTIAATYPAAVIGMALIKLMRGSILEENMARTVGSIGESVAAGAIFTIPAFVMSGVWPQFFTPGHYVTSALIMCAGGVLGIMFVALLRRVMVEDAELPYPESVAAAEIHKAGATGGSGTKFLFGAMGIGAAIQALVQLRLFASTWEKFVAFKSTTINLVQGLRAKVAGGMLLSSPGISPAYMGVGYIIGPKLGALNFSGGLMAWGLLPGAGHPACRRYRRGLGGLSQRRLEVHRSSYCDRWHARGRGIHAFPHAQEPWGRASALHLGYEEGGYG